MTTADFRERLENTLWRDRDAATPRWKTRMLRAMRTVAVLLRDTTQGELTLRAMSLVYTTLLSLVPLLALSFSVLKAFGVHSQIRPFLHGVLAPLGQGSGEITERIIVFIENVNVGVLGSMGLVLLIYTAVSLVQKVEEAFNLIWHITRPRSFGERFSRYLTLLLVGPILVFSALGVTASVMNGRMVQSILDIEPFGQIIVGLGHLTPYLLVIAAFTVAYYYIPNTRVRPASALLGGVVAGIAWQTAGWIFAEFAASSTQYQAIYSSFAILILFMIWLYLSWRIVLFGASVAFYYQRPEYLVLRGGEPRLSNRMRERLALGLMGLIAGNFLAGRPPLSRGDLARRLGMPEHAIQVVLDVLEDRGLLIRVGGASSSYLPTRDLATVSLAQLLETVRSAGESRYMSSGDLPLGLETRQVVERIDNALDSALAGLSVIDLTGPASAGEDIHAP